MPNAWADIDPCPPGPADHRAQTRRTAASRRPRGRGLTRDAYRAAHATSQKIIDQVSAFAGSHGLTIHEADPAAHTVKLRGTYAMAIARAAAGPDRSFTRGRTDISSAGRGICICRGPLASHVVAVMGMDPATGGKTAFSAMPRRRRISPTRRRRWRKNTSFPQGSTAAARRSGSSSSAAATRAPMSRRILPALASHRTGKLTQRRCRWQQECRRA